MRAIRTTTGPVTYGTPDQAARLYEGIAKQVVREPDRTYDDHEVRTHARELARLLLQRLDGETAQGNDATHPAVAACLSEDMMATAAALDSADADSMAADVPWKALQQLRTSVEALFVEAEGLRDDTAKTYRPAP